MFCFHQVALVVLGYSERSDKPGSLLVSNPGMTWDALGYGSSRPSARIPRQTLTGDKEHANISWPAGTAPAHHLMLTLPQLLQAINGHNNLTADRKVAYVHALAPLLTLEAPITKGTWLQTFKDVSDCGSNSCAKPVAHTVALSSLLRPAPASS